ncbi:MAG: capsule assembly Wzi family protein [Deltaproteobacteria bacterium]|nr:capsule assembly Wzi family protein [Deltaproteobacteria bacterium]
MKSFSLVVLVLCAVVALPLAAFPASPEIFLADEPEIYLLIDKLEGYGLLPGLMTDDRGLEAREVAREAVKAVDVEDPFAEGMLQFLRLEGTPRMDFRLRAGFEDSRHGEISPNSQGLPIQKDWAFRLGGFFRDAPTDWLALQARGDYVTGGKDGRRTGRIEETSVRIGWPQGTLEAGRFSLWWGPGRHGSLLFTTNAEPLIGTRLRNPRPIPVGGWFRFLGLFQYDLFLSRLEKDRPIPHPYLAGMRLALKPKPWLEIGASRAMHFGGEGRSVTSSTLIDTFTGKGENDPNGAGNQLASFDAKVRLPLRGQPVVLYMEGGAEDHSSGWKPSKWAWLGGIFLPSIGGEKRFDFRLEFADTYDSAHGTGIWYRHLASGEGYAHAYKGQVLGHHLGTDARDFFAEAHYFILPASYLEINADLTQRFFPGPAREETRRFGAGLVLWLSKSLRNETRFSVRKVSNENGVPGMDGTDSTFQLMMAYQYRGF